MCIVSYTVMYDKIIDDTHILTNYTHNVYIIRSKLIVQGLEVCKLNKN